MKKLKVKCECKNKYKSDLIDALNRMDELACEGARDTTSEEVQLQKDYDLLFNFIEQRI